MNVEQIIKNSPEKYEAFLYRFTNLENSKKYIGIHKGFVGDGYLHSSTNEEFIRDLSNDSIKFKYEILNYGDYKTMTVLEYNKLTSVDAQNKSEYYNNSNGIPNFGSIDIDKCLDIVKRIKDGEFNSGTEEISILVDIESNQVRDQNDSEHEKDIKNRINDEGGSTSKCDPLVIFESWVGGKKDILVDGNMTLAAADKAQYARKLPVARIPKEISKNFNKGEVDFIGIRLNPIPEKVYKPTDTKAGVKFAMNRINAGMPKDSSILKDQLRALGFTSSGLSAITRGIKKELDKQANTRPGHTLKNYDSVPRHRKEIDNVVDQTKNSKTSCIKMSSGYFKIETIMDVVIAVPEKKLVVIKLWHPSVPWQKKWDYKQYEKYINFFFNPLEYYIQIDPMEMWEKDAEQIA